jgi:hypothetical protein
MLAKYKILTAVFLISSLFIKCEDKNSDEKNCDAAICTMEFRSIVVSLKHKADQSPFVLSDYSVVLVSDNTDITPVSDSIAIKNGFYPVTDDSKRNYFRFKNTEVEFKGYLNNELVIERRFIITADCCHISLVDGETSIML